MQFSRRTSWPTTANALSRIHQAKMKQGERLIDLTESNPTRCSFKHLNLESLSDAKNLVYEPDPHGLAEAREAVCRYYAARKVSIRPNQVFLTASTSEAYSFVFRLLTEAGDAVLVPRPGYPLLDYLAQLNDMDLARYPLVYDEGWRVDFQGLEKNISDRCRTLVVVNPNNPTGNFVHADEKEELVHLCIQKELAIISDEVFLDFAFADRRGAIHFAPGAINRAPTTFAGENRALTFTLGGISKILGLPQMKLSWMVVGGPPDLMNEAIRRLEIIADTYLSVNTPVQRALGPWLGAADPVIREINERICGNRRWLEGHLKSTKGMEVLKADGGWYAVMKVGGALPNDEKLAVSLLEKHNVLVHPGYLFDFTDGDYLVTSLLPPTDVFQEGVKRLCVGIMTSNGASDIILSWPHHLPSDPRDLGIRQRRIPPTDLWV